MALAQATASSEARRAARLCAALTLLAAAGLGVYQIGWGERFGGHGIGKGDSRVYVAIAQDFPGVVFGKQLDAYRLQRVLPSGLVYAALSLTGLPRDEAQVVRGFLWLNLIAMLGMLSCWHLIADELRVSHSGRWLGCLLLFVNFQCLRAPYYSPVLTDYFAAALSSLLLYGFVRGRTGLMLATLVLAAFTWPALFLGGAFLLVFPLRALPAQAPTRAQRRLLALVAMAGFMGAFLARLRSPLPEMDLNPPAFGWGGVWLHRELLPVSLLMALMYAGFVAANLWNRAALMHPAFYREFAVRRSLLSVGALLVLVQGSAFGLAAKIPAVNDPWYQLQEISAQAVLRPANPWVAHAVAFGLLPVLLTVVGRNACRAAHDLGAGFTLFLTTVAVLALTAETRQLMHSLAPLTLLAVLAVEGIRLPAWAAWAFSLLAFIASKLLFNINGTGFFSSNHPFSSPAQNWWMNVGLWMSDAMYWRQGAAALVALALVTLAVRQAHTLDDSERARVWPPIRTVLGFPAVACAVAALFGAAELSARLVLRARLPAPDSLSVADATLGWRNVPGAAARPLGALVAINSRGLRGPDRDYAKPSGGRRVLLLGGSIVEGFNAEEDRTLRAALERAIAKSSCGRVEVLNAGVAGYAIDQQSALYAAEGRRYATDVVVVVVHYQDLRPLLEKVGTRALPQGLRTARRNTLPWRRSAALRLLSDTTLEHAPALHRFLGEWGVVDYGEPPPELWPYSLRDEAKAAAARFEEGLGQLASAVIASGARPVVLYAPARFEVDDAKWDALLERYVMPRRLFHAGRLVRRLERVTEDQELLFLNPLSSLQREARAASMYDDATELWNDRGYETASVVLADTVTRLLDCGVGRR